MKADEMDHTLTPAFESLIRAGSALLLDFQLDLASATVSLARRVRTASTAESGTTHESEVQSILSGVEGVTSRARHLFCPDATRELSAAGAHLAGHIDSLRTGAVKELLAA